MAVTEPGQDSGTIRGTGGDDVLRVASSVTFDWMPDPGDSRTAEWSSWDLVTDPETGEVQQITERHTESGPGEASGFLVFRGVSSSEAFTAAPGEFAYGFNGDSMWDGGEWSWDPVAGVLDGSAFQNWDNWIGMWWTGTTANYAASRTFSYYDVTETGHWSPRADPGEVTALGGGGDDTIYGGQGRETVYGGSGHDRIHAGFGEQTLYGGSGGDQIHAGFGDQTLYGGSGDDLLQAGHGEQILYGGSGGDVFELGGRGGHVVVSDFEAGHDVVRVARGVNGLAVNAAQDLAARVTADDRGNAMLDLGAGEVVTLTHVAAQAVATHPDVYFVVA